MILTNKLGLPEPLFNAVKNDPYDNGGADISVTGLIGSPWRRRLGMKHRADITEDVSERIYALLGQAVHRVLERAWAPHYVMEKRLFANVGGKQLSGQFDLLTPDNILQDYKVTSYFACKEGPKIEWERQLNVLNYLCLRNDIKVKKLEIVAIIRDWSRTEKKRYGDKYPDYPVMRIPVNKWGTEQVKEYVVDQMMAHFNPDAKPCTYEERWSKPTTWAVKKKGTKRALRVFENYVDAQDFAKGHHLYRANKDNIIFEKRPGEDTRCLYYCNVSEFCTAKKVDDGKPELHILRPQEISAGVG